MKALMIVLFGLALIGLTLWFIHGGELDPECATDPERVAATALHDSATCVKRFP